MLLRKLIQLACSARDAVYYTVCYILGACPGRERKKESIYIKTRNGTRRMFLTAREILWYRGKVTVPEKVTLNGTIERLFRRVSFLALNETRYFQLASEVGLRVT